MEVIRRMQGNMALFRHPKRTCVYDEAEACIRLGKDSAKVVHAQIGRYRERGYPDSAGLAGCYFLVRRHNDKHLREVMATWWHELCAGSRRDQLSFDYSVWTRDGTYASIAEDLGISQSSMIDIQPHLRLRSFRALLVPGGRGAGLDPGTSA
jgi:hypothetical protein